MAQSHLWLCHWQRIDRPLAGGRSSSSIVWVCEYPYHTIRLDGPGDECADCPVWEAIQRERARQKRLEVARTPARRTPGGFAA